jgi:hypothetical protein
MKRNLLTLTVLAIAGLSLISVPAPAKDRRQAGGRAPAFHSPAPRNLAGTPRGLSTSRSTFRPFVSRAGAYAKKPLSIRDRLRGTCDGAIQFCKDGVGMAGLSFVPGLGPIFLVGLVGHPLTFPAYVYRGFKYGPIPQDSSRPPGEPTGSKPLYLPYGRGVGKGGDER